MTSTGGHSLLTLGKKIIYTCTYVYIYIFELSIINIVAALIRVSNRLENTVIHSDNKKPGVVCIFIFCI